MNKRLLKILMLSAITPSLIYAQGFSPSATNFSVPNGGQVDAGGHAYGFNASFGSLTYHNGDQGWATLDMNGDGLMDLVVTGQGNGSYGDVFGGGSSPYWKVYMNNGTEFASSPTNWSVPNGGQVDAGGHAYGFNASSGSLTYHNGDQGWTVMDMNGDAKPDLVVTGQGNGSYGDVFGGGSSPYWKVYMNNGTEFASSPTNWSVPNGGQVDAGGHAYGFNASSGSLTYHNGDQGWTVMDMNGDAKPDLVVTGQGNGSYGDVFGSGSSPYWKVYLNNGTEFASSPTNWSVPNGGQVDAGGHAYGFNASSGSLTYHNGDQGWITMDIDIDGKPDLVVTGQGNGSYGDVFGSGSSPYWKVYKNNGSGFETNATTWNVPNGGQVDAGGHAYGFNASSGSLTYHNGDQGWVTMDIDGDNKMDLVVTGQGNGSYGDVFGVGANPYWKIFNGTGSGFSTTSSNWDVPNGGQVDAGGHAYGFNASSGSLTYHNGDQGWVVMDMNGDNLSDLVVTGQGNGSYGDIFGVGSSPYWKIYKNESPFNELTEVRNNHNEIGMYPNPAHDKLTISNLPVDENYEVSIYNINGQLINPELFNALQLKSEIILSISELKPGTYVIHLTGHKSTISKKLIKL